MLKVLLLTLVLYTTINGYGQVINFSNLELKQYLINELCVDTTNNGFADIDADLNNDNEIQYTEAIGILNLHIDDLGDNYYIKSVQDINHFQNLNYLKIVQNDSIVEISNLNLDSLKTLWIGSCYSLKVVDISNLNGLTEDFRVEDIDTLDYLNIQNGSIPQYFSLFYSDHIHYACVDSIAAEYDEVAWKMISGLPTIDNCISLTSDTETIETNQNESMKLFPNPTNDGIVEIKTSLAVDIIKVFDFRGVLIKTTQSFDNIIYISDLKSGMYFIELKTEKGIINKKLIKN